ncbi:MAG: hypothetical protein HGB37_04150 [Candidatus Moranbacteria bacterium]|nr:hypothetical protein [Candidatus Moranbacteria bacterium]
MNDTLKIFERLKILKGRLPELVGGLFVLLIVVLAVYGIRNGLRIDSDPVPADESLRFDRGRDGISVSIGDQGYGIRFPYSLDKPIEIGLPDERDIKIVEQFPETTAELISGTLSKTDANRKLLSILSRNPTLATYRSPDGRKSDLYTYQEAVSGGQGSFKHWILYENGDGKEIASYRIDGAHVRISDAGDAQVYASTKGVSGQPDFVIPRPYFLDRDGRRTVLNWTFDEPSSILSVSFTVPKGRYPVALDPTVQFDAGIATIRGFFKSHGAVNFSGKRISQGDYLFEAFDDAEVALSLRQLDDGYEGDAIRVRRDSDDAEADFGFDENGLLDMEAIETWLGSSDGYVTTWYGQDPTGYDAVQATEGNQPQIAEAGAVLLDEDGVPVITFDGADDFMTISSLTLQTYFSLFVRGIPGDYIIAEHGLDANSNPGFYFTNDDQYWMINRGAGYYGHNTGFLQYPKTASGIMSLISGSDAARHYYDGDAQPVSYSGSQHADSTATDTLYLSSRAGTGLYSANRLSEFVLWDGIDQTAEISDIVENMTDAWPPLAVSPDFFAFADTDGVDTNTLSTSDIVEITGADGLSVSISGEGAPTYRICSDATCTTVAHDWTTDAGSIDSGEYLQLRLTSSSSFHTIRTATVTVGGGSNAWDVTTKGYLSQIIQSPTNYAWALAKVNENYAGPALRVERSSDSTQTDIGFTGDGSLDTTSLLSFVGSGDGYVTTMYEQFGSSYDMTMNNDPLIVDDGVLVTHGDGSPAISFNEPSDINQSASIANLPLYTHMSLHARMEHDDPGGYTIMFEHSPLGYSNGGFYIDNTETCFSRSGSGYHFVTYDLPVENQAFVLSEIYTSDGHHRYENSVLETINTEVGNQIPNSLYQDTLYVFGRQYTQYNVTGKLSALIISDDYDDTSELSDIVGYMMAGWPGVGTADPFELTDDAGVELDTLTESGTLEITGSDRMPVSISGDGNPSYRICSDASCTTVAHDWSSSYGSIEDGEYLQLRLTSDSSYRTTRTATVSVGGQSDEYDVTTKGYLSQIIQSPTNYAWALAKVNENYAGPALRVERSSDSTQTDIGFTGDGSLDTTSLLSFVGSGDGRVVTLYEQFESAYDMVLSNDPLIVDDGTLITHEDGSPAISFNPSGDADQSGYVTNLPLYADMSLHYRVEVDVPTSGNVMLLEHSECGYCDPGFFLNQEAWLHTRGSYIEVYGGDILDETLTVHSLIHRQSDGASRYEGATLLANVNNPRTDSVATETLYVFARQLTTENVTGLLSALIISNNYDNTSELSDIVGNMTTDWPD